MIENNDEMRETLVAVIDSNPEMMCSFSFTRCEEALAALQKESPPQADYALTDREKEILNIYWSPATPKSKLPRRFF